MKYEVEINGRQTSIELEQRDGRLQATVDTRKYEIDVVSPEEGLYTFLSGDRVYEASVWTRDANKMSVTVSGRVFTTNVIDRKHRRQAADQGVEGRQNLVAPMPGKVVRVLLAVGDEVKSGQGVLVVEAMKMQNEIKSPKPGRSVELRVVEGASVNANQILAVVE